MMHWGVLNECIDWEFSICCKKHLLAYSINVIVGSNHLYRVAMAKCPLVLRVPFWDTSITPKWQSFMRILCASIVSFPRRNPNCSAERKKTVAGMPRPEHARVHGRCGMPCLLPSLESYKWQTPLA
jgi:hypothetical protein